MLFTHADVARLQFSDDGSRAIAYVVFVSHERFDGEHHAGITIDVPLVVQPGESINELRDRAVKTACSLLRIETAEPAGEINLRKELQSRVNNLLASASERWAPRFAMRGGRFQSLEAREAS